MCLPTCSFPTSFPTPSQQFSNTLPVYFPTVPIPPINNESKSHPANELPSRLLLVQLPPGAVHKREKLFVAPLLGKTQKKRASGGLSISVPLCVEALMYIISLFVIITIYIPSRQPAAFPSRFHRAVHKRECFPIPLLWRSPKTSLFAGG